MVHDSTVCSMATRHLLGIPGNNSSSSSISIDWLLRLIEYLMQLAEVQCWAYALRRGPNIAPLLLLFPTVRLLVSPVKCWLTAGPTPEDAGPAANQLCDRVTQWEKLVQSTLLYPGHHHTTRSYPWQRTA